MRKLLAITLIAASTIALAQKVPPPPRPKDNGPSLEVTMKYIEDRLNAVKFHFLLTWVDSDGSELAGYDYAISMAQANPNGCSLAWHDAEVSKDDNLQYDSHLSIRDVRAVSVQSASDVFRDDKVMPDFYVVTVKMQPGKTVHLRYSSTAVNSKGENDIHETGINVPDEDWANRLAKAIVHAVDLCGGGDNDPFK